MWVRGGERWSEKVGSDSLREGVRGGEAEVACQPLGTSLFLSPKGSLRLGQGFGGGVGGVGGLDSLVGLSCVAVSGVCVWRGEQGGAKVFENLDIDLFRERSQRFYMLCLCL